MEVKKEPKKRFANFIGKLRVRYRVVVVDDRTFDEKWHVRLSPLFLLLFFGGGAIVIVSLTTVLIAWTPLREYIPGYPDGSERGDLIVNASRVDSLESKLNRQENYIERLKTVIGGGKVNDEQSAKDSLTNIPGPETLSKANKKEKDFRKKIDSENSKFIPDGENSTYTQYFYVPVNGEISSSFNPKKNHLGCDISTVKNAPVKASLNGTIIFSGYTSDGGYEIHIQHKENIVTIYKHNSTVFKNVGDKVKGGETIALTGNTGETSKGNHLHFEIWENGIAIDPEEYIGF